jgi:phosphatidylglycerol---prolipoprotein diacylglyceryl transferase
MPQGFYLGPIFIYFYGIIIVLGALAGTVLVGYEAKRHGYDSGIAMDMLPWLMIAGIIGARLWHIITPPASMVEQGITFGYYLTHPIDAINIRKGGLGIPGAVIGGAIALWFYCRKYKLSVAEWLDFAAPGLALAQAIGRWGNYFNQELYGKPSNLPWAISIAPQFRLPSYANVQYYHPLFLYEFLWNLVVMSLLLWAARRFSSWLKKGDVFLFYLVLYPAMRFFLEFLRLDPSPVAGINANQTLMAVVTVLAVGFFAYRQYFQKTPELAPEDEPQAEPAENELVAEKNEVGVMSSSVADKAGENQFQPDSVRDDSSDRDDSYDDDESEESD